MTATTMGKTSAVPTLRRCHWHGARKPGSPENAGRQVGIAAAGQSLAARAGETFQKGRVISSSGRPGTPGSSP